MMSKIPPSKPHCFQPLIPGFLFNFSIPKSFLKYIGGSEDDDNGEKMIILRDKRKINWYVKMDGYHFKDGWQNFCKQNNLQVGDFVVLKHQGQLIFDVFIFDPSACEREFPSFDLHFNTPSSVPKKIKVGGVKKKIEKKQKDKKDLAKGKVGFKPSGHPYWPTTNKRGYLVWGAMPIPQAFARENGLAERRCEMVLVDENGKSWSMALRCTADRSRKRGGTTYIGGWPRFAKTIGLKVDDHLIFELLDNGEKPVIKFYRGTKTCPEKTAKSSSEDETPNFKTSSVDQPVDV